MSPSLNGGTPAGGGPMSLQAEKNAIAVPSALTVTPGLVEAPQCGGLLPGHRKESPLPDALPASLMLTSWGAGSGRPATALIRRSNTSIPESSLIDGGTMSEQKLSKTTVLPSRLSPGLFDAELQPIAPVKSVSTICTGPLPTR